MGALFFMLFLFIAFIVAIGIIILSTVFIILWKIRKSRGKNPNKWCLILPIITLIISIMIALIPVNFILFLRTANSDADNNRLVVYAESGRILYWPMGEYGPTTSWFEMNEQKYVECEPMVFDSQFFFNYSEDRLEKPIANIRYNPSHYSRFDDFMNILLVGKTYPNQNGNISTVYPVINDSNFSFYYVGPSGGSVYCDKDKFALIKAYYSNGINYDTEKLISRYSIYSTNNSSYIDTITKEITLAPLVFEEITQMSNLEEKYVSVKIPQKYIDIYNAAVPGTPIFGYEQRELYSYSKDKMAYMHLVLVMIDDQIYVGIISHGDIIEGYPLPDEMNHYIKKTVFIE